ncbi:conserved hypothetical protein [Leptospira interrogans serovar Manilae]|uniref:SH3b domain-containing protein n=1 Tax=Leptospira interrogans serovar Manilae TaxID=214675 RepID=A0AAQ1SPL7_LEPIR|nr:SH3 domain-containing protein [Leptospira interrogans]AKP26425.1 hypothetical protein LIMLP_11065 [Leptospira interrogans serovar Manilae]AKP30208.1 hypothetical protein LIMHP_11075 [Leptospira interrogans serovar Manilae]EYU61646.1 hypothetical protein CI00_04975 [Leptospira interrogans serovar Manilae]SOR62392.1 conserved hypothetical protein [Leptospira interrogans serovar Manilae]
MLFVFSFFLHTKCKKIEPIGKGYVLTTGLCIHKEPSYRSECQEKLERGNIIKILEYKIKDKDPKYNLYWYHVLSDKSNGYISLDEEISRGNFGTILSYNGGTLYVNASALRVRSLPSLTGEIIENLPNGTAVSVVGTTPFKIKIDDKYDNWSEVQTPSGKIGFCYSGYLRDGSLNHPGASEDSVSGVFIVNNNKAILWTEPGVKSGQFQSCNSTDLGKYLKITAVKVVNNVKYYLVEKTIREYGSYSVDELGCINAWISEGDGQVVEDLYEWSLKEYGYNLDTILVNHLHESQDLPLFDVSSLKIRELDSFGKKGETLFEVIYDKLDLDFNSENKVHNLYAKMNNDYYLLLNHLGDFSTQDFDNDGLSEWIVKSQLRSGEAITYYARKANSLIPFLYVEEDEFGPCHIRINDSIDIDPSVKDEGITKQSCEMKIEPPFFSFKVYDKKYKYKFLKGELIQLRR